MQLKASAPGSLMLLGEHAVLHGHAALVCAIDKRMDVTLIPRQDDKIRIQSALGDFETTLLHLQPVAPFSFVLMAIKQYAGLIKRGFDLVIESQFSHEIGFGSSAAVTVATLAVVAAWLKLQMFPMDFIRHGRQIIRQVQGLGSGADVAASVLGGMVSFRAQPLLAEKLPHIHDITALYTGFKTPTVKVIDQVQSRFAPFPGLFKAICQGIGECSLEGIRAVRKGTWQKLGEVMRIQQGLMVSLGVSTPIMGTLIESLEKSGSILGAKISGSGLGDCVVGLGKLNHPIPLENNVSNIVVAMSSQGVQYEKS